MLHSGKQFLKMSVFSQVTQNFLQKLTSPRPAKNIDIKTAVDPQFKAKYGSVADDKIDVKADIDNRRRGEKESARMPAGTKEIRAP